MDDSLFVRRIERVGDLRGDVERFVRPQWPAGDAVGERLPWTSSIASRNRPSASTKA
jgi:hypothetical protein